MSALWTIVLLFISNIFMTLAWYGHLKLKQFDWFNSWPLFVVIVFSWGIAFFEYCFQVSANRIGFEGPPDNGLEFWGSSFISDPFGVVVAEASVDKEEILIAECSTARMEEVRRGWPFLRDRRIDAYGPIVNRWLA